MIITRKVKIPSHWLFYVQLPLVLSIYGNFVINAPFLFMMKRFIDNPAAIMGLISIEFYVTWLGGPFIAWLSDRIWTRFGRRKFFFVIADAGKGLILLLMPFAPNLWTLIILRWVYGAVGDFGAMTQALIYETVPPPQRGKASGIFSSCMQIGNLVFFFLLIGRFDDLYFMGPFRHVMELNGGAIMFWLCAFLLLGIAMYEGLGFKEIKPPNRKTLHDGRRESESTLRYFLRSIFQDVFAKDFMPLYLFMFINVMFGVSLGVFQPLLFTEQWGYSLQDLGNTVAIGVITTVTFSLISGWFADKYGKLQTFLIATILSFGVNIFYTIYVYYQPDHRPSLTEIVVIGNVAAAIGMVKGVVTFPLMMEYVRRDRMGAANAGMGLFGALIRNMMTLFVGVWLLWWSIWFFPQAGTHVEATFPESWDRKQMETELAASGIDLEDMVIKPLHQYGIDGETSMRWWIHHNNDITRELLKERKDLNNELDTLETKVESPLLSDEKRTGMNDEISGITARLEEIEAQLQSQVEALRAEILPVIEPHLYPPGGQVLAVAFADPDLYLTLQTIEPLNPELLDDLVRVIGGPQFNLIPDDNPDSSSRWRADLDIEILTEPGNALSIRAGLDPRFLRLYRTIYATGRNAEQTFSLSNALIGLLQANLGRNPEDFDIQEVSGSPAEDGRSSLTWTITASPETEVDTLAGMLQEEDQIESARVEAEGEAFRVTLRLPPPPDPPDPSDLRVRRAAAVVKRLNETWETGEVDTALAAEMVIRFTDTLNAKPFYVTVPEHTPRTNYRDREYEYFFASQTLMIFTDIIGFAIIMFLLSMEKKGVVHRAGVEEDQNR